MKLIAVWVPLFQENFPLDMSDGRGLEYPLLVFPAVCFSYYLLVYPIYFILLESRISWI